MIASLLAISLALGASPSKLGAAVLGDPLDADVQKLLAACPRLVHWTVPNLQVPSQVSLFRVACPGSTIVVRSAVPASSASYDMAADAIASANDFWSRLQSNLAGLDPTHVAWLEGTLDPAQLPDWTRSAAAASWVAAFWSRLADLMNANGWHPLVGTIPAHAPPLDGEVAAGSTNLFKDIADTMKAKPYPWGWAYAAFSKDLATDADLEAGWSLRFRATRTECGLAGVPLVLARAGRDPGWRAAANPVADATYLAWIEWLDGELQKDADVRGAALFELGEHIELADFDLSPLAADLAAWIASPRFPDGGTVDGGDAGSPHPDAAVATNIPPGGSNGQDVKPMPGCGCSTTASGATLALAPAALAARRRKRSPFP